MVGGVAASGVAFGLASGPPGWIILGTAMIGGSVLGYVGSKVGGAAGQEVYRAVKR